MNYIIFILMCMFVINGCDNNEQTFLSQEMFYNSNSGVVNEYIENVYYVKNNQLCCGIKENEIVADNVCLFHVCNYLYYVKKVDSMQYLYKYDGNEHIEVARLPEGIRVRNFSITKNAIYVQVDNSLYIKGVSDSEFSKLEFKIADTFVENDGNVYYHSGEVHGNDSLKDEWIHNFSKMKLIHTLNKYNVAENKNECLVENTAGFILTPVRGGIVYYDVETCKTILYRGDKKKTLMKNKINDLLSDGDSIIYNDLANKGIYKMHIDSGEVEKLYDENILLAGATEDYLYTDDGEFINIEQIND